MRVLLYSRAFSPAVGGMERFAEELATWLTQAGHQVWVATATPAHASVDSGRPYRVLRSPSSARLAAAARWSDVVQVNGLALRAIGPAWFAGKRLIVTHAGHQAICPTGLGWVPGRDCTAAARPGPCSWCPQRGPRGRVAVVAHRLGARLASRNVSVSHYLHRRLALPNGMTIYNPVSHTRFARVVRGSEDRSLIAFAGRLVAEKGLDLLLRALVTLRHACLEVAGDGPMRPAWESLARELSLEDRVRFLGQLSLGGVTELYARAAFVCVPSVCGEAFGYAAAEAMAAGKAVVATPRGALPELLADGRGLLASDCTPGALARTLQRALEDTAARSDAGARARAFALQELDINRIGPRYLATYEEVAR